MKIPLILLSVLLAASAVAAPIEQVSKLPFPTKLEFPEIQKMILDESFKDPAALFKIENGRLFSDVGFESYARRAYSLEPAGELSVTIVTLMDFRAAYSLLTLLRSTELKNGPPGDAHTVGPGSLRFFQGRKWISIESRLAPQDLIRRVAISVSSQIGPLSQKPPSLVSRFPKLGFDFSTLRYFPSLKTLGSYSGPASLRSLNLDVDAEIAQARYSLDNQSGIMSLLDFPTDELAEDYFASVSSLRIPEGAGNRAYSRRAGPIVGLLVGRFEPGTAQKVLSSLSYSYSVRWVYEKKNKSKIIWGVPISILETVVKSIFFVVLLCLVAIITGAGSALLRFVFRDRASRKGDDGFSRDDMTRLRLR